jgi:AcrR family transcriptional regulator
MPKRAPRKALTRDAVMDAALALADREGLDAVTIRALAADVGVPPMTLYAHFADKDALFQGMRTRLVERVITAGTKTTWRELLETLGRELLSVNRTHPSLVPLIARTGPPPEAILGVLNRLLTMMHDEGYPLEEAIRVHVSVIAFSMGMAMVERTMMGEGGEQGRLALLRDLLARLPLGSYPNLAYVAARIDQFSLDGVFDAGIRTILDSADRKPGAAFAPAPIRRRRSSR